MVKDTSQAIDRRGIGGKKAPVGSKGRTISRAPMTSAHTGGRGIEGDDEAPARRKKKKVPTDMRLPLFRLFRTVVPDGDFKISRDSINILNQMLVDLVDRVGYEGSQLCKYSHKDVLRVRDMQTALRLVVPTQELLSYAQKEGDIKLKKYVDFPKSHIEANREDYDMED